MSAHRRVAGWQTLGSKADGPLPKRIPGERPSHVPLRKDGLARIAAVGTSSKWRIEARILAFPSASRGASAGSEKIWSRYSQMMDESITLSGERQNRAVLIDGEIPVIEMLSLCISMTRLS